MDAVQLCVVGGAGCWFGVVHDFDLSCIKYDFDELSGVVGTRIASDTMNMKDSAVHIVLPEGETFGPRTW